MSTVKTVAAAKKPVATSEAKKTEVVSAKTTPIEMALEKKAEEAKKTVKKETKAAKPAAKKTVKKTTEKTAEVKKTVAKATKKSTKISVQYADKDYSMADFEKIATDVWVYDCGKKAADLKDIQLYVKPEENKVYYVFNGTESGSFNI